MKRILNLGSLSRIVEGDPNEVTDDEILVIRDKIVEGKIIDIQMRVNGKLTSLITEKYTYTINPTPADATVIINGSNTKTIRAAKGHTVTWSVSKTGYTPQSGSDLITGDVNKNVTLVIIQD